MKTKTLKSYLPLILAVAGGIAGWLYYHFVGCVTGTCPIAANPFLMPIYGAVIGGLLGYAMKPEKQKEADGPEQP